MEYVVYSDRYGDQEVYGPFDSEEAARRWMEETNSNVGWIMPLKTPA